ncbi:MAG TPA: hypothetical protein PKC43_06790 [Phycisphaerales bacterium]|nr:hypothetical protein [Phycisphaerales bacterium]HMP37139.1 hypothetical protein [Phycisphaerales bacterium]
MFVASGRPWVSRDRLRRLRELVMLAAALHGWNVRQLAAALGRDPGKLLPANSAPKIDFIMRLADVLGWGVDDLLAHLEAPPLPAEAERQTDDPAHGRGEDAGGADFSGEAPGDPGDGACDDAASDAVGGDPESLGLARSGEARGDPRPVDRSDSPTAERAQAGPPRSVQRHDGVTDSDVPTDPGDDGQIKAAEPIDHVPLDASAIDGALEHGADRRPHRAGPPASSRSGESPAERVEPNLRSGAPIPIESTRERSWRDPRRSDDGTPICGAERRDSAALQDRSLRHGSIATDEREAPDPPSGACASIAPGVRFRSDAAPRSSVALDPQSTWARDRDSERGCTALAAPPAPALRAAPDAPGFDAVLPARAPSEHPSVDRVARIHAAAQSALRGGRHGRAVELHREALAALSIVDRSHARARRAQILLDLADSHHRLGEPLEARAIASEAVTAARMTPPEQLAELTARALLLRAACTRDLIESRLAELPDAIDDALADVVAAERFISAPADRDDARPDAAPAPRRPGQSDPGGEPRTTVGSAIAHRAAGLRIELEALRSPCLGSSALARILAELDAVVDLAACPDRALLESHGWWCVSGFALAHRHMNGSVLHRTLGILSNKADEIADAVDSWPLRERVLMLEYERRERLRDDGGTPGVWLLDRDDVRTIVGCIGGSRRFRAVGLRILRTATLLETTSLSGTTRRRL